MQFSVKVSYLISIILCLTIFLVLPELPSIGTESTESLFTLSWLILSVLVLTAHIRHFLSNMKKDRKKQLDRPKTSLTDYKRKNKRLRQ
ncbi:hypothetical protein [Natranaerobius trueperi]|uniref:Uncharacterized protein n=1 Tax=Natranaerobius trueperi TaxID=759412 RepID=A0A226C2M8_9FIRM|nr:hypothetical protein [Natranaerobius trueperi]OWZ84699.1 hypothetical protein CDO51_01345 [Natranaerobius trueperi]